MNPALLKRIVETLCALEAVMTREQALLCGADIGGSALQQITEEKSALLATLDYLEKQREPLQSAERTGDDNAAHSLREIEEITRRLRDLNQHNGWLLENQLIRNQQALAILKPYQAPDLYGKDGYTASPTHSGKKFSV